MSSPSQVAAGFTITGLLDGASRTRGRYPVSEIAVADIADHPANAAYSMDPAGIAELAESIRQDGLTDLPLVRKVGDGSWQMVSGHRRKAAYALLAKDDPAYERMPCRVIEGIDDERAVTLLHAANYFTRATPCASSSARRLNRLMAICAPDGNGDGSRWVELVGPPRNGHEPRALALS